MDRGNQTLGVNGHVALDLRNRRNSPWRRSDRTAPPAACHRRAENETRDALADAELGEAEVVDEIAGEGPQQAF